MGFKIADGYVSVTPDDDGFESKLRAQIAAATDGLKATVGLDIRPDAADAVEATLGASIGAKLADAISDTISDELPPKIEPPMKDAGVIGGDIFTRAFGDEATKSFGQPGLLGNSLSDMLGKEGAPAGQEFTAKFSQSAKDEMLRSTLNGMLAPDGDVGKTIVADAERTGDEAGKKLGDEAGKSAAKSGEGGGGLMMAALAGGMALGAPALLAAAGTAFVGVAALGLKSNKVIAADYVQLGKTAEAALTQATAPLAGVMNTDVQTLDTALKGLQPTLDGLFANLGPDITSVTGGLIGFTDNLLPGLSTALDNSHADVQGFASGLGSLGTGVGGFFTGLTRDSLTTGAGLQATLGLVGNTLTTLGTVAGSASSALSADLMAVIPAADALLSAIDKIADPATVGAGLGALAVKQFSSSIKSGLQGASDSVLKFGANLDGMGGGLSKLAPAAESTSMGLSKMADVMGGPWGIAIGAGIGLLSGLAGSLFNASHASDALTLSQTNLTQATQQDNDTAGSSTAALVAQTFATDGLSKSAQAAGVSASTWTQAVLGSKTAQEQIVAAVSKTNQATVDQAYSTNQATASTGKFSDEQKDAAQFVDGTVISTNRLTTQNQQLINSLNAQTKQVATSIAQQTVYEQSMAALTNTEMLFNASLTAGRKSLVASAQASALTTVANLGLSTSNYALNTSLDQTLTAYQETSAQASAYSSVLSALNGTTMGVDQATNALDQQMLTAKTTFKANKDSLDQNTQAGISDRQALVAAAQAIVAMGVAQEQATGSVNKGNATIQQQITKFVDATGATGKARQAIESYLESIAKIPANASTTVHADTSQAMANIATLQGALAALGSSSGASGRAAVQVEKSLVAPHKAAGGDVQGGHAYVVGDGGREEMFVAPTDGYIYPSVGAGQQAVAQHNAQVAAASSAHSAPVSQQVHQYFYGSSLPNGEQRATMRRELAPMVGIG